jgi:hypothetical protein
MAQETGPSFARPIPDGMAAEDSALHPAVPALQRVKLSVVIPCYNEDRTLEDCVDRVLAIEDDGLDLEIIVVDDCSTDESYGVASRLVERVPGLVLLRHEANRGKGAALRTGIARSRVEASRPRLGYTAAPPSWTSRRTFSASAPATWAVPR